jgi:hypothetical protein
MSHTKAEWDLDDTDARREKPEVTRQARGLAVVKRDYCSNPHIVMFGENDVPYAEACINPQLAAQIVRALTTPFIEDDQLT